ncbi:DNA methyltransferase [bacterium E08(2017)]|nr:DNA methyltransferase [bacterium E08(2017)]
MTKKTAKKQKSFEETLWDSANKLRGSVEPSEYKHVVLSLIFLKFVSDKFEERKQELIDEGKDKYVDMVEFYTMKNVFYLPEESRWSYIKQHAKQDDISIKIDTALLDIEKENTSLKGALPRNYFSGLGLVRSKLSALVDTINNINTLQDKEEDVVGRVYEYFISRFAEKEGKGKGEYYTPKSIVNLIAELIEPYKGIIYDPCCGSGGMFVQSAKFVENHQGSKKDISIYGQEGTSATLKLARMNLAIRGLNANLGEQGSDTFSADYHPDLKADYVMANPPFNQKDWRAENELLDDPRWSGYPVPPASNANYGWILHMISKLSANGTAGFILANGAMSGAAEEYRIRKQIIENKLIEAIIVLPREMFYATDISVTLWIINKNKKAQTVKRLGQEVRLRDREDEVLFIDVRKWGSEYNKKFIELTSTDISNIAATLHNWQCAESNSLYQDVPEYCFSATLADIREKDYSLITSKYIEFVDRDMDIDFDAEMSRIAEEFVDILSEETQSLNDLKSAFKGLGYDITR